MKTFKLRMSLFRIWFMKNILVFIQIVAITLFILVFAGILPSNTPIFGKMIAEIKEMKGDASGWINTAAVFISCFSSIGVFMLKARSIALSDIKSDKLKYAMFKAGLYFDEKGHLTKRVEKIVQKDLDGDGKVDDKDVGEGKVQTGFFSGLFTAIRELFAIATVKIDETKTDDEALDAAVDEVGMKESAEGIKELDNFIFSKKNRPAEYNDEPETEVQEQPVNMQSAIVATGTTNEEEAPKKEKRRFYAFKFRTESEIEELKLQKANKKKEKKKKVLENKQEKPIKTKEKSSEIKEEKSVVMGSAAPIQESAPVEETKSVSTNDSLSEHNVNNFLKNLRK